MGNLEGLDQFLDHLNIVHGLTYMISQHDATSKEQFSLDVTINTLFFHPIGVEGIMCTCPRWTGINA
ncbi:hypothetical protein [Paenibacillus agricola]|uniref:hypothetical protein n=1 Tax=Paenibacillus agricola TaxID=2716264 RepID=UPI001A9FC69E|nr:hypothetical protein [Paenibacillus agricola]